MFVPWAPSGLKAFGLVVGEAGGRGDDLGTVLPDPHVAGIQAGCPDQANPLASQQSRVLPLG